MKFIVALLDKGPKGGALKSNKLSKETLLLLNVAKGVLKVRIVRWGLLRGRTRFGLTKSRGWMMGCRLNNLLSTRYPIMVTSGKEGSAINFGKWQKPISG